MKLADKKAHDRRQRWHRIFHRSPRPDENPGSRVDAIALPPAEDLYRDSDRVRYQVINHPETPSCKQAALNRSSHSEDAQMTFAQMLGGPAHRW
jgi:hypothetical protein